jgi:hypothetical protein
MVEGRLIVNGQKIIDGLKDAIAFAEGDRSRGRLIAFLPWSHRYWRLPESEREHLRKAIGADEVRKQRPIPLQPRAR